MDSIINKKELKDWIDTLDDEITLLLLQSLKNSPNVEEWFWNNISAEQKQHIIHSLKKAKESDTYTQQELWQDILRAYTYKPDPEVEKGQIEEAKRRMKQLESGKAQAIPLEEAIPGFWERLEELRGQEENK